MREGERTALAIGDKIATKKSMNIIQSPWLFRGAIILTNKREVATFGSDIGICCGQEETSEVHLVDNGKVRIEWSYRLRPRTKNMTAW